MYKTSKFKEKCLFQMSKFLFVLLKLAYNYNKNTPLLFPLRNVYRTIVIITQEVSEHIYEIKHKNN